VSLPKANPAALPSRALSHVVRVKPFMAVENGDCVRYRADGILSLSRLF